MTNEEMVEELMMTRREELERMTADELEEEYAENYHTDEYQK